MKLLNHAIINSSKARKFCKKRDASYINNFDFKRLKNLFEGAIQHQYEERQSVKSESNKIRKEYLYLKTS